MKRALIMLLLLCAPLFAQDPAKDSNPLIELRAELKKVLTDASVPFTEQQDNAIALMMEERRQASEDLFGQLMDYRSGPVQGEQQDRAVAAIQWMRNEFKKRLGTYLTSEQMTVWQKHETEKAANAPKTEAAATAPPPQQQTQLIRLNNNMFTAEGPCYGCGGERTEVIQKGGVGAFHGNASFDFKDESLNARNPFAQNRPPYQVRTTNGNVNGPFIRNRLTANVSFFHTLQENADTIHATTPQGPFDLGISHPYTEKNLFANSTYQLSERHSLMINGGGGNWVGKNQGIGGLNLPDRASTGKGSYSNINLRQFSVFSPTTLYETRFGYYRNHNENQPKTSAIAINVLGNFSSGGAQNFNSDDRRQFNVSNLFTRIGSKLTSKLGFDTFYLKDHSRAEYNFLGSYTFSSMEDYLAGNAASFSVTRGNPLLDMSTLQYSFFYQGDFKLTPRLTTMFGMRYEAQKDVKDHNGFGPRAAFAFAANKTTVIRGGTGVFYQRYWDWMIQTQLRADGNRQYDIVIDNPLYNPANPDPFTSGSVAASTPPSIRVTDPHFALPYEVFSSISVEKTFFKNFFINPRFEHSRGVHQYRSRNLNALPGTTDKADPAKGNIWNLESTGFFRNELFGLNVRHRFSIFNLSGNYTWYHFFNDNGEGAFGTPSNNFDLRSDWGRSGTPIHQLNTTVNAKLFWGFFLTNTMNFNSGNRYNITTGNDDNGDGNFNDRPAETQRNAGDGPRFLNFNFNVSKAFYFSKDGAKSGGQNVNMYANMSNAFNRTNYGTPSGVLSSPSTFGKPYSARSAREINVGLRYQF